MNRFMAVASQVSSFRARLSALLLALTLSMFAALPAFAQGGGSGFGAAVTDTIDDTKGDVTLIGIAVLGVIVLIAAIAWVSRAINK